MRDWPRRPGLIFSKKLATVLLLAVLLAVSACVKTIRDTATTLKAYDPLPARALIERVNALQSISSLSANASIRVIDLRLSKQGKVEPYRPADGLIVLQRPELIRMLIRVPILKQNIADMTSDGEHFRIAIYYPEEYKQFLTGSNSRSYEEKFESWKSKSSDKEKLSSLAKIRPQHITEALLIKPIDTKGGDVQYFVADLRKEEAKSDQQKQRVLRSYEVLYILERVEDGELRLQRQLWFDRTQPSLPLAKMELFNGDGTLVAEVDYKQYQRFDSGAVWPRVVEVSRAQDNYAIEITFDDIKQNSTIDKRAFVLENLERLPEHDLDAPQQPPRASPEQ